MAPALMTMCPAASLLTTMLLFPASPKTDRMPAVGENDAVTARRLRSSRGSRAGYDRPCLGCLPPDREAGRDIIFRFRLIQDGTMRSLRKEKRGTAAPGTDLDP